MERKVEQVMGGRAGGAGRQVGKAMRGENSKKEPEGGWAGYGAGRCISIKASWV